MTMPHERTRSLRWGSEVLQEIFDDDLVDISERTRAAELLRNFPTAAALSNWIQSDVSCIPAEAALAIEGAGELLRVILRSSNCFAKLKHSVLFTLRHYPDSGSTERWTSPGRDRTIREWLLPEDWYD